MIIEGKFMLKAPIQLLWDTLLDPETLRSCIPGAEKIERIDEKSYDCLVKQKVGPISVKLSGNRSTLSGFLASPPRRRPGVNAVAVMPFSAARHATATCDRAKQGAWPP